MLTTYRKLFSVSFEHSYFSDGRCRGLGLEPTTDTAYLLKRHAFLFRQHATGFDLLFENASGKELTRERILMEAHTLRFYINLTDVTLFSITTGLPADPREALMWFTNIDAEGRQAINRELLHAGEFSGATEIRQLTMMKKQLVEEQMNSGKANEPAHQVNAWQDGPSFEQLYFTPRFGIVEIKLHEQLGESLFVRFESRSLFWRYILISPYLNQLENPMVVNINTKMIFQGPEGLILPDGKKGIAFISKAPIPLSQIPDQSYRLGVNYDPQTNLFQKDIILSLPNPDPNKISDLPLESGLVIGGYNVTKNNLTTILI